MKKSVIVIVIVAAVAVAAAVIAWWVLQGSQQQTGSIVPATGQESVVQAGDQQVTISNFTFNPIKLTIKKGATVTWTNQDPMGHNILADSEANSGGLPVVAEVIAQGGTFGHTFNTIGTFAYHCGPHPYMKGTVKVVE